MTVEFKAYLLPVFTPNFKTIYLNIVSKQLYLSQSPFMFDIVIISNFLEKNELTVFGKMVMRGLPFFFRLCP